MDVSKSGIQRIKKRLVLLLDRDPKHTLKFVPAFLQENHARCLPNPANSHDLNAVENVWSMMDDESKKMKFAGKVRPKKDIKKDGAKLRRKKSEIWLFPCRIELRWSSRRTASIQNINTITQSPSFIISQKNSVKSLSALWSYEQKCGRLFWDTL